MNKTAANNHWWTNKDVHCMFVGRSCDANPWLMFLTRLNSAGDGIWWHPHQNLWRVRLHSQFLHISSRQSVALELSQHLANLLAEVRWHLSESEHRLSMYSFNTKLDSCRWCQSACWHQRHESSLVLKLYIDSLCSDSERCHRTSASKFAKYWVRAGCINLT